MARDRHVSVQEFDEAMRLSEVPVASGHDGGTPVACRFDPGWVIGEAVNGGLVMAVAATALRAAIDRANGGSGDRPDPLAFSAYFLSATAPGPGVVTSQVVRAGRVMTTGQVSVAQPAGDGSLIERMRALATFGDLGAAGTPDRTPPPPRVPAPQECVPAADAPAHVKVPLLDRLDLRLDPTTIGWAFGQPSRQGRMRGWLRLADGRDLDPIALLFALDALPPVSFDLGIPGWAPTLELTAHVRARPAPGWVQIEVTSDTLAGGVLEEDARIWDATGRLVAQSRQLAAVRMPAAGASASPEGHSRDGTSPDGASPDGTQPSAGRG